MPRSRHMPKRRHTKYATRACGTARSTTILPNTQDLRFQEQCHQIQWGPARMSRDDNLECYASAFRENRAREGFMAMTSLSRGAHRQRSDETPYIRLLSDIHDCRLVQHTLTGLACILRALVLSPLDLLLDPLDLCIVLGYNRHPNLLVLLVDLLHC